jgi:hypothetical protein
MKAVRITILLLMLINALQAKLYWIFLEDDPKRPKATLSERAQNRIASRADKFVEGNRSVLPYHVNRLQELGLEIYTQSRFLNAVSAEIQNQEELARVQGLPFVLSVQPVGSRQARTPIEAIQDAGLAKLSDFHYGNSLVQNEMLGVTTLHEYGYDGNGLLLAIFDTGFNRSHPAFDLMDILEVYDFVDHDTDVSTSFISNHGDDVLSVVGGYVPGELIGPAYGASYVLARTEDMSSETRVEEHNWLAAVEWADSLGADIISSSLVYFDFDGSSEDYPLSALDGNTTIIAQAANLAAARGMLVVNANGNSGPAEMSLWSPNDSPHVLSVGAVKSDREIASFSSRGPTYDGRIKPDVVAMGASVRMVSGDSGYKFGNGTSYSTPLIAGLAALLMQNAPGLSPDSIISIFRNSGDRATNPDNTYGYGIPDIVHLFEPLNDNQFMDNVIYPNPSELGFIQMVLPHQIADAPDEAYLFDITGRRLSPLKATMISNTTLRFTLPSGMPLANQLFIVGVQINDRVYSGKFIYIKS